MNALEDQGEKVVPVGELGATGTQKQDASGEIGDRTGAYGKA